MPKRTCSITDCAKSLVARGWCWTHYQSWRRYGDPMTSSQRVNDGPCSVVGCERDAKTRSLCQMHYNRLRREGTPGEPESRFECQHLSTQGYYVAYDPNHPVSDRDGNIYVHRQVLYDKIGPGHHLCHYCGTEIRWAKGRGGNRLTVDHIDAVKTNNDPDNLVPCCLPCNSRKVRLLETAAKMAPSF